MNLFNLFFDDGKDERRLRYELYLKSEKWKQIRIRKFKQVGRKCEVCGSKKNLQCHHLNYERLGKERLSDLQILCTDCHAIADEERRYSKGLQTYCTKKWGPDWQSVVTPEYARAEFDKWLSTK